MCVRGVTAEKAALISKKHPSMASLYDHYRALANDEERESYFRDWGSESGGRRFGPALSRRISLLLNSRSLDETALP